MPNRSAMRLITFFCLAITVAANAQQRPSFEVSTVKPTSPDNADQSWDSEANRLSIQDYTLRLLIKAAYGLNSNAQILNGPDWLDKQRFDVSAKIDEEEMAEKKKMVPEDARKETEQMLQSLLAERFQLKVKQETRPLPTYALVRIGPQKMHPATGEDSSTSSRNGHMTAVAVSMDKLAVALSRTREVGTRPVINRTGLSGNFTFELNWTPDRGVPPPPDATDPGLFTALREQLGLKLEEQTNPVPVIVIEAATLPAFD